VTYFRFPYLREGETRAKRDAARRWLAETGQTNLPVTIDTADWAYAERWVKATGEARDRVREEYLAHLRTVVRHYERLGDRVHGRETPQILLLHANSVGADNLDALLSWLARDHRFVTVDEIMADPAITRRPDYVGRRGVSLWWRQWADATRADDERAIRALMNASVADWNAGNLTRFVSVYEDDARFVSSKGVTVGRQKVLDRYRRRYPDRAAMGTLSIDIQHLTMTFGEHVTVYGNVEPTRPNVAIVIGRWTIRRKGGEVLSGETLVVLRRHCFEPGDSSGKRGCGRWLIMEDHSS